MKNLLVAILLFSLYSCGKSNNTTDGKKKTVDHAFICFEKPVLTKSDDVLIGIRYFKNYADEDNISVTLNGKQGVIKASRTEQFVGTNCLFKLPPVGSAGDFELVVSIKNNQTTFTDKKVLRVIDNNDIGTVWDSFEYEYILKSFPLMSDAKSAYFQPNISQSGLSLNLGPYFDIDSTKPDTIYYYAPFLSGISGRYMAHYDDAKKLKDINVLNAEPLKNINAPTYQEVLDQVAAVYGPPVSTTNIGHKVTTFETPRHAIKVHDMFHAIETIITLK